MTPIRTGAKEFAEQTLTKIERTPTPMQSNVPVEAGAEPELSVEMQKLERAISRIEENLSMLSSRLTVVLRPSTTTPNPPEMKTPEALISPLSSNIRACAVNVRKLNEIVESLLRDLSL
jgi:hypothetical protein